ncbi:uncharacterized protein F5891DRAFT_1197279 [Suillus fuscotomentosus]|uniref:Uncharacterized protein n=1 Tax=Suillus fuscotomentosus TaxID=1912939 RepID=A0AAD4HDN7_9AGAM|nr:uncharacterized protein F5891DRAFT_1197279 [Suillus fuscotomentosus]KAG1891837.1 hypothetical protein F5891DRAFT_1197279 [Suillus fuscotomentosus]
MSAQPLRGSRLVIQTLNPTVLPPTARGPSGSSRVLINNLTTSAGQKRKHVQTLISQTRSTCSADCQLIVESPVLPPSNKGDIQLNVLEQPCLLLETTPSDAPNDDLVWNSVLLHTSDLYTRTLYWDALVAVDAVFRISVDLWVLQDWDGEEEVLQLGSYFHVVYLPQSDDEYGDTLCSFIDTLCCLPLIAPFPAPPAVLLQLTPFNDKFIFSCASAMGRYESGKRVVVTLQQDGRWHCHSCRYSDACKHKPHAKAFALEAGLMVNM